MSQAFSDMTDDELKRIYEAEPFLSLLTPTEFNSNAQHAAYGARKELERRYPPPAYPLPYPAWTPPTYADKRRTAKKRKADREETERLTAAGYRKHETDWEIHRGGRQGERIIDAIVSHDGRYVWTKLGRSEG